MPSSELENSHSVKVSLKYKFAVFSTLLILVVCFVLSAFLIEKVEEELKRQIHLRGMNGILNFAQNAKYSITTENRGFLRAIVEREIMKEDVTHVVVINERSLYIGHSNPQLVGRAVEDTYEKTLLETTDHATVSRITIPSGETVYDFILPVLESDIYTEDRYSNPTEARKRLPERKNLGIIRIGISFKKMEDSMRKTYDSVIYISIVIALVSIFLAFWYGKILIKPLTEMTRTANRLASGYLDERVEITGNDEISVLADNFNTMAKSLQESRSNLWKLNKDLEYIVEERTAEVKKAYEELQQIDELKSTFLSTVSHELRTPLTSILGFAKMIEKQFHRNIIAVLPEEPRVQKSKDTILTNLEIISVESNRLARLINDVLDLAKIESGKMNWQKQEYDLLELCQRAINNVQGLLNQSDVTIELRSVNHPLRLVGDPDRILQVITNLLSNAIKFTKEGVIICCVEHKEHYIQAYIKDPGIGIAEEDLLKVFDKFLQVGDTLTNKPKGTGLGLSICREIIEFHQGQIWADSSIGKGSTFYIALPIDENRPVPSSVKEVTFRLQSKLERMTKAEYVILIADEDPEVRDILQDSLEREGYRTIQAVNGKDAYDLAMEYPVNAILLDIMMYEIDGFDTPHHLKNNPKTKNIPIILLSIVLDNKKIMQLGATAYITYPMEAEKILNRTTEILRNESNNSLSNTKLAFFGFPKNNRNYTRELKNMGIELDFHDTLPALRKAIEQEKPTILFVDFKDSKVSPNTFFKSIRNDSQTVNLPVVVVIHAEPIAKVIDAYPMRRIFSMQDILGAINELFSKGKKGKETT